MVSLNLGLCVSLFGERVMSLLDLLVSIFESCSEMPFCCGLYVYRTKRPTSAVRSFFAGT